jgi:ABC-type bacteriocin/lantibiotic exporter with double-glycine peptidase domain
MREVRSTKTPVRFRSAIAVPSARLELATGSFKQTQAMCGPACLKIVFAFFGRRVSEKQIARACRSTLDSGTTGTNLVRGAKKFGFTGKVFDRSDFRSIAKWLRRGVPVVVDWMSTVPVRGGRHAMACGHYSVVCGLEREHIVLQDPAIGGRRRVCRKAFLNVWFDFKNVFPKQADDLVIRRMIIVAPRELLGTD